MAPIGLEHVGVESELISYRASSGSLAFVTTHQTDPMTQTRNMKTEKI